MDVENNDNNNNSVQGQSQTNLDLRIKALLDGRETVYTLPFPVSEKTLGELKTKLFELSGVEQKRQRLIYLGKVLVSENSKLSELGVVQENTLLMVEKPRSSLPGAGTASQSTPSGSDTPANNPSSASQASSSIPNSENPQPSETRPSSFSRTSHITFYSFPDPQALFGVNPEPQEPTQRNSQNSSPLSFEDSVNGVLRFIRASDIQDQYSRFTSLLNSRVNPRVRRLHGRSSWRPISELISDVQDQRNESAPQNSNLRNDSGFSAQPADSPAADTSSTSAQTRQFGFPILPDIQTSSGQPTINSTSRLVGNLASGFTADSRNRDDIDLASIGQGVLDLSDVYLAVSESLRQLGTSWVRRDAPSTPSNANTSSSTDPSSNPPLASNSLEPEFDFPTQEPSPSQPEFSSVRETRALLQLLPSVARATQTLLPQPSRPNDSRRPASSQPQPQLPSGPSVLPQHRPYPVLRNVSISLFPQNDNNSTPVQSINLNSAASAPGEQDTQSNPQPNPSIQGNLGNVFESLIRQFTDPSNRNNLDSFIPPRNPSIPAQPVVIYPEGSQSTLENSIRTALANYSPFVDSADQDSSNVSSVDSTFQPIAPTRNNESVDRDVFNLINPNPFSSGQAPNLQSGNTSNTTNVSAGHQVNRSVYEVPGSGSAFVFQLPYTFLHPNNSERTTGNGSPDESFGFSTILPTLYTSNFSPTSVLTPDGSQRLVQTTTNVVYQPFRVPVTREDLDGRSAQRPPPLDTSGSAQNEQLSANAQESPNPEGSTIKAEQKEDENEKEDNEAESKPLGLNNNIATTSSDQKGSQPSDQDKSKSRKGSFSEKVDYINLVNACLLVWTIIVWKMAERKAQNKYYPPDWDPSKGSINKYVGQHPLRDRARKLDKGILIIRFEMPFNIWCGNCKAMIAT
ncbi:hypothetical protein BB560_006509, partial [Smittium megazygosporum]